MTDDEKTMLKTVHDRLEAMDTYLMQPTGPGKASRAEALDKLLDAVSAGKGTARAILYVAGFIVAVASLLNLLKGYWVPR